MKKLVTIALVSLVLLSSLIGCAKTEPESKLLAMIIPIPAGDPFINLAYKGLEQLGEEKGYETKLVEALEKSEYSEQVRAMSELGAKAIYVMWDDLAAEVVKIAPEFPEVMYIIVDCYITTDLKNVKTIVVEPQQASFIAGFVASKTTTTNKVAWIGSMKMPVIDRFRAGFEAGVKYGNPDVTIESVYIGTADDPNKGAELAKQIIGKGADVIMQSANKAGLGVIQAAKDEGVLAIGVDDWQGSIDEKTVFWSALKDIGGATYNAGLSVIEGNFVPGIENYDIKTGVKLYDERDYAKLSSELKSQVDEVAKLLKNGDIEVPTEVE